MRDSIYRSGVVFPKLRPFCQLVTVPNVSQMQLAPTTTLAAMPCLPRCLHHTSHNAAAAAATINPRSATADVGRMVRSRRRPHATAGLPYGTHYQSLWSLRAGMAACPSDLAAAPCASSAKAQPTWTHHVSGGWPDSWLPYRLAKSPACPAHLAPQSTLPLPPPHTTTTPGAGPQPAPAGGMQPCTFPNGTICTLCPRKRCRPLLHLPSKPKLPVSVN